MSKRLFLAMLLPALNVYSVGSINNEQIVSVNNYPSNVHHNVSGTVVNIDHKETEHELKLIDAKAKMELESLQKPVLVKLGDAIAVNYNYLVEAKPFGVPYGFPIAASIIIAYVCYEAYKNKIK
jgi:hypothetical protein